MKKTFFFQGQMWFWAIIVSSSVLFASCNTRHPESSDTGQEVDAQKTMTAATTPFNVELIVRTIENVTTHADAVNLVNRASANGVKTICLAVKQDEDDEAASGTVFYKSSIAPIAPGYLDYDALADVIGLAHAKNIKVKAWIPQFHDQTAFLKNSDWPMVALVNGQYVKLGGPSQDYFVNPIHPDVQAYERSIIREVAQNYNVDSIVLDWIRFDDFNMDLSAYTRNLYGSSYGYDPSTIDFSTDNSRRQQWNEWRRSAIGSYVQAVRNDIDSIKPGLPLGIFILPPEFIECGQDASKFKNYISFISPMAYFSDWGYPASWVYSSCIAQTKAAVGDNVEIIPGLNDSETTSDYGMINAKIHAHYPGIMTLTFFEYSLWTSLKISKVTAAVVPTVVVSTSGSGVGATTTYTLPAGTSGVDVKMIQTTADILASDIGFPKGTSDGVRTMPGTIHIPFVMAETLTTYELWSVIYAWAISHGYTFANPGTNGYGNTSGSAQQPVTTINWRDTMIWCNALTEYCNANGGSPALVCVYNLADGSTPIRSCDNGSATTTTRLPGGEDNPNINPAAKGFRLPTNNEYEYAARYRGSDPANTVSGYANPYYTKGNSASGATADYNNAAATMGVAVYGVTTTAAVKSKDPNALGLYDMSGNVYELCFDWVITTISMRYRRGGAFNDNSVEIGYWTGSLPQSAYQNTGFRFARNK